MLSRQALVVDNIIAKRASPVQLEQLVSVVGSLPITAWTRETHLGGDDQIITLPAKLPDGLTHYDLRLSGRINLSTVKEVHSGIIGGLHALESAL